MTNQALRYTGADQIPAAPVAGWNDLLFSAENGTALKWQLYIPENFDRAKRYPTILYMHSAGVRCSDNSHVYTGEAKFLRNLETGKYRDDVIVLAPCCPKTDRWVAVDRWNCERFDPDVLPQTAHMQAAIELFANALRDLPIDRTRLYLYGMSMGGFAVWDILARYPRVFAAAAVAAGCGAPMHADRMTDVGLWIFHGTEDGAVPYARAVEMKEALEKAGKTDLRYTAFEGLGHGIWVPTANTEGLYDWLFAHKRDKEDSAL